MPISNPPAAAAGLAGTSVKTIGTSGDYSDVAAAIAGESTPYHFVLVSDVTEDSGIPVDGVVVLDLDVFTLTLGSNSFTYAAETHVTVLGKGPDSGAEFDYAMTLNAQVFENSGFPASVVRIDGILLDNNSGASANNTYLSDGVEQITNCRFELNNDQGGGVGANVNGCYYDNLHFVGGGTACFDIIDVTATASVTASNLYFTGTYKDGAAGGEHIVEVSADSVFTNLIFAHETNDASMAVQANGTASNIKTNGTMNLDVRINGANTQVTNVDLLGGAFDVVATDFGQFTNIRTTGLIDVSGAGAVNNLFTNCKCTTAISLAGDRNKFVNCEFIGGGAAVSGALHNIFNVCQFGADAGGGALTFTLDSGANTNIVRNCISDAAIVDNGTSNEVGANIVF